MIWLAVLTANATETREIGADAGKGNLVGVQTWMRVEDYQSAATFERRLDGWLAEADRLGWLRDDTVVVLPEYVGTWLVALDEKPAVYEAAQTRKAMSKVVMRHLGRWRRAKRGVGVEDRATYGVFAMKADAMAAAYQQAMGALADRYDVTLVAGSILLPTPRVEEGRIVPTAGEPLQNASFVFGPDGALLGDVTRKVYPTADEVDFVKPGTPDALPVYDTPAGPLGVLICADAWFPATWETLAAAGVGWVAIPQYTSGEGAWDASWKGYSGQATPPDVDLTDVGSITEGEAWARYAWPGRGTAAGVPTGLTVPLRGELWDLGSDGQVRWATGGERGEIERVDGALIVNVWRRGG